VRIETRLEEDLPPVLGDATLLEQVILNLATNARDAMPDGGTLEVNSDVVELDPEYCAGTDGLEPGRYLRVAVLDTGCGMDPETAQRVFEPFFTTKEVGHGTGLGLSTVYGIVRSHGGEVLCHSRPGEGTRFVIHLPTLSGTQVTEDADPVVLIPDSGGSETILVVDDEPQISELAGTALEAGGYEVIKAGSGEEALGTYIQDRDRISLVVLDLGMPGMGGRRCLAELTKLDPSVKVLVASGYTAIDQVSDVIGSGARRFIAKPYRLAELTQAVRELLDE
jgi:CheY-like chemotaxis protein